jgi:cyclopropane fatty-acyl-phospholipid synthase-like methyltransferase
VEQSELKIQSLYEAHARACNPKDFQKHVMRTTHGSPVGQDQIDMIIEGVSRGLDLARHDVLLDLCCGNGAITDLIFARCAGGLGVDFTPYLIEVAKANFEKPPTRLYQLADVLEYLETANDTERFTKATCYGAFACLSEAKASRTLRTLRRHFPNLGRVFIGNLPDLDRAGIFWRQHYGSEPWPYEELKRHDTAFGIWRSEQEVTKLTAHCGWRAEFTRMPAEFYGSYYRFDAILTAA